MMSPLKMLGPPVILGSITLLKLQTAYAEELPRPSCPARAPNPAEVYQTPPDKCAERKVDSTELERFVNMCRQEVTPIKLGVKDLIAKTSCFIRDSTSVVRSNIEYLRGAPQEVQVGAIVVSGLAASLLGFRRRGLFRKVWYGSLGALGAAAVIYPEESSIIAKEGFQAAKCYGTVAYNFILGRLSPGR